MQTSADISRPPAIGATAFTPFSIPGNFAVPDESVNLRPKFLRMPKERGEIAELRKLALYGAEQDLQLGLVEQEQARDEVARVAAVYRNKRAIATLRFVPTGHGLTAAERLAQRCSFETRFLDAGSWEVGRLIMAPDDRHPRVLLQVLSRTLEELMEVEHVEHFHNTATAATERLWRTVGMRTVCTVEGTSGTKYALMSGTAMSVADALEKRQARAGSTAFPLGSAPANESQLSD